MPTAHAQREYLRAPEEIKEVIREIIREDPEAEIKAAEIKRLKAELKRSQEETASSVAINRRLNEEIENSDAWIEEMTTRANQKLFDSIKNVDAGIECMLFDRLNLIEPTRQALSTLHFTLTLMGRRGEFDIQDVPTMDYEDV
jgi:hypothetical protein